MLLEAMGGGFALGSAPLRWATSKIPDKLAVLIHATRIQQKWVPVLRFEFALKRLKLTRFLDANRSALRVKTLCRMMVAVDHCVLTS